VKRASFSASRRRLAFRLVAEASPTRALAICMTGKYGTRLAFGCGPAALAEIGFRDQANSQ